MNGVEEHPECIMADRPAASITEEFAELQEHMGRTSGTMIRYLADGRLTYPERQALKIKIRGIITGAEELLRKLR